MKKAYLLFLLLLSSLCLAAQIDTTNITISNYALFDGTYSYRTANAQSVVDNFYDKTSTWNSSDFQQGHLKNTLDGRFAMNYRFLTPKGYDQNYDPGYPLMILLHGYVERANCWTNGVSPSYDCWFKAGGTSYQRYNSPGAAIPLSEKNNLLNNDHQLLNGGTAHLAAWNKAGTKRPNDPTLDTRAFPGFIMFPQMFNGWQQNGYTDVNNLVRVVRLFIKKYNVDPNRVYIQGLSNGGEGVLRTLVAADWLFAAAAPMSPVGSGSPPALNSHQFYYNNPDILDIPIWIFQGGKDTNPTVALTNNTALQLRAKGAVVRHTIYPNLGHGVWNTAYAEPDFFTWFLGRNKSDLHVEFGLPRICSSIIGDGVKLSMPREMYKFEWEKDGVIIGGESSYVLNVTSPGIYRGRFSRVTNPTEAQWNQWSKPVEVGNSQPAQPTITNKRSLHLSDLNDKDSTALIGPTGFFYYKWFFTNTSNVTTEIIYSNFKASTSGEINWTSGGTNNNNFKRTYTLKVLDADNCPSNASNGKVIWMNKKPTPIVIAKPTNFKGALNGPVNVILTWDDVTGLERGYEIWRSKAAQAGGNNWTLVTITPEDAVLYNDTNLDPGTTYYYKIRGVSDLGYSDYAPSANKPSNLLSDNVIVTTLTDVGKPSVPQNLTAEIVDTDIATKTVSILLSWDASTDDSGVSKYRINYGNKSILTPDATTTFTISGYEPGNLFPINSNFNFTVQAIDKSNNASPRSIQVNVDSHFKGLYWNHNTSFYNDLALISDDQWKMREFTGKSDNLTLAPATQDAYVLIRFFGYLYVSTPGEYKIRTKSNDGTHIYFDGDTLIFHNQVVDIGTCLEKNHYKNKVLNLAAGPHAVEIRYWQSEDDMCLSWEWQGPDAGPVNPEHPEGWYPVPDERLRSYETIPPLQLPEAPTAFTAVTTGTSQIMLDWEHISSSVEFEVHRALTSTGPFNMIDRVTPTEHLDQNLTPGTTYWYKVRAVNDDGVSAFTPVRSATTLLDDEAPSTPINLVLYSNTLTSASIGWSHSTDDVAVTGYEIWLNGVYHSSTSQNFIVLLGLTPQTDYTVYVVAYDASNNKSAPSNVLPFSTRVPEVFYSRATGDLNALATWGKNTDGTGTTPLNFSTNGYIFVVANRASTLVGGNGLWTVEGGVSKIVVPSGVTLNAENIIQGNVELSDNSAIVLTNNTQPTFLSIAPSSTVHYDEGANLVQLATYGNLVLSGTGSKTFANGITTVRGNLLTSDGIALNGAEDNGSTIILYGDYTVSGSPGATASGSAVTLDLRKGATQTLGFNGTLNLFQLSTSNSTSIDINNAGVGATFSLGSNLGGGLFLPTGSNLHLQNNTLKVVGAGTINSSGETGEIHAANAVIDIATSSDLHSNLYFNSVNNTLRDLNINATGGGGIHVQNPSIITDGIKIRNGDLNSNGNITLISNSSKTANLHQIEGTGRVVGDVHVQRYFNLKSRMYRYLSTPVQGTTISNWQTYFAISGNFTDHTGGTTSPSLYTYNSVGVWSPYPTNADGGVNAPIEKGKGYAAYIRNTSTFTMTSTGVPNQGPVPYTLFAPSGTFDGWNLVGNPYASTIRWSNNSSAWSNKVNVSNIVAVRNNTSPTAGHFLYFDSGTGLGTSNGEGTGEGGTLLSGKIAQGQSFYVQTTNTLPQIPTLTINEAAKFNDQQGFYREGAEEEVSYLFLNLRKDDVMDQAIVTFTAFGTDSYDANFDASKLRNDGMFNFSTLTSNDKTVAINNMSNSFCDKSIKMNLEDVTEGDYVLDIPSPETLYGVGSIKLVDNFLNSTTEVSGGTQYLFSVTLDPASFGKDRFELIFNRPEISTDLVALNSTQCSEIGKIVLTKTQKGASYAIVNHDNEEVTNVEMSFGEDITLTVPSSLLNEGINKFKVKAFFSGCSSELFSEPINVEYYKAPILAVDDVSTCPGYAAAITIVSENPAIAGYAWYNADNVKIKGFTGDYLETEPILSETFFSVAPVLKNGCEGYRQAFLVYPEDVLEQEIVFQNDTLFTTADFGGVYEWKRNGEVLKDAQMNFITGVTPAEYEVTCTKGGCSKTSRVFMVTGLEESPERMMITSVFPNPTSTKEINLRVISKSVDDVYVKVIDVVGKEHFGKLYSSEELRESVKISPRQEFRAGVYFVILKQNNLLREVKFIVKE